MGLRGYTLDAVNLNALEVLVDNEVPEDRHLEYKESLPGNGEGEKKEFLADLSAFANAEGGDMLYGIREKRDENNLHTGCPESLVGIAGNEAQETERLQNLIRDGLDPKLPALVQMKPIPVDGERWVLLMRIPKSWAAPHMVTLAGDFRFYIRGASGKQRMDVQELKALVLARATLKERLTQRRLMRIASVLGDDRSGLVPVGPKAVVHLLFANEDPVASLIPVDRGQCYWKPLARSFDGPVVDFDGTVTYRHRDNPMKVDYCRIFRNGDLELLDNELFFEHGGEYDFQVCQWFSAVAKEIPLKLKELCSKGCELPAALCFSLLGVKGIELRANGIEIWEGGSARDMRPIDRDQILLPPVVVEELGADIGSLAQYPFEVIWQSAGVAKAPSLSQWLR